MKILADETYGHSYSTSRLELDAENFSSQIEYDTPTEMVLKYRGETRPPKKYLPLADEAARFSECEQILNYFLDGSRRVFKIDDIAYVSDSRKMVYSIVAGQSWRAAEAVSTLTEPKCRPPAQGGFLLQWLPAVLYLRHYR